MSSASAIHSYEGLKCSNHQLLVTNLPLVIIPVHLIKPNFVFHFPTDTATVSLETNLFNLHFNQQIFEKYGKVVK